MWASSEVSEVMAAAEEMTSGSDDSAKLLKAGTEKAANAKKTKDKKGEAAGLIVVTKVQKDLGKLKEALSAANDVQAIFKSLGSNEGEGAAMQMVAEVNILQGDVEAAIKMCTSALAIFREMGHKAGEMATLHSVAKACLAAGSYSEAVEVAEGALELAKQVGDAAQQTSLLQTIAAVRETSQMAGTSAGVGEIKDKKGQADALGKAIEASLKRLDYKEAASAGQMLAVVKKDMGEDLVSVGETHLKVADYYKDYGAIDDALKAAKQAIANFRTAGNALQEAKGLDIVAGLYFLKCESGGTGLRGAKESALAAARQQLALVEKNKGSEAELGRAQLKLAMAHDFAGQGADAVACGLEAASTHQSIPDKNGEAAALQLVAEAHRKYTANYSEALMSAADAYAIYEDLGSKLGMARAKITMADTFMEKKDNVEAAKAAAEALAMFEEIKDKKGMKRAKKAISEANTEKQTLSTTLGAPINKSAMSHAKPSDICAKILVGSAMTQALSGQICILTGGSRGIGKGIAMSLAEAGGIVYVTGRSTLGNATDQLLMGTVDETAAALAKLGGLGVALHVDHAQHCQNMAVASLIGQVHGRLDMLVNNAFFIPKPDQLFFGTPSYQQPIRYLHEQVAVGGFNHIALTMMMVPSLRRGRGAVVNVSSWGSQVNIDVFPASYLNNKALFDESVCTLAKNLKKFRVFTISLWPGSVRSERSIVSAKRTGAALNDAESTRFSGRACVAIAKLAPQVMLRLSGKTLSSTDCMDRGFERDIDGHRHESELHTVLHK